MIAYTMVDSTNSSGRNGGGKYLAAGILAVNALIMIGALFSYLLPALGENAFMFCLIVGFLLLILLPCILLTFFFLDVRCWLENEALVDIDALPERDSLEPYWPSFAAESWRRLTIAGLRDPAERGRRLVTTGELQRLFAEGSRVAEEARRSNELKVQQLQAENSLLHAQAAREFYDCLPEEHRAAVSAMLAAEAAAQKPSRSRRRSTRTKGERNG